MIILFISHFFSKIALWLIFDPSDLSALGIGLPVFIICSVTLFLIWLYKQRRSASKFVTRSVSDPYLNDPEGGSVYYGIPVFSYKDLEEATNYFDIEKELGDGGFGTVYLGKR